jgi:molybdate transport system ATP-binding protein
MTTFDLRLRDVIGRQPVDFEYTGPGDGITAIWGPSGSGKTTFLRFVAGLTHLRGRVSIDNALWQDDHRSVPSHRRGVGYVFQEASLFPHLNVEGNLDFAFRRNCNRHVDRTSIIEMLGVGPLLRRSVANLSGGERQRVALARTLMSAPRLLLLDEPLSSLDGEAKAGILPLIRTIAKTVPILYVGHDPSEITALADRVLRVTNGALFPSDASTPLAGLSDDEIRALAEAALLMGAQLP